MQLLPNHTGHAFAIFSTNDHSTPIVDTITLSKGYYSGSHTIQYQGQILSDSLEYEPRLDAYFHQSDDGSRDYVLAHILSLEKQQHTPTLIDGEKAKNNAAPLILSATQQMLNGDLHADDLAWAARILTYPVWLHSTWLQNNQKLKKTQRTIAKNILRIKL